MKYKAMYLTKGHLSLRYQLEFEADQGEDHQAIAEAIQPQSYVVGLEEIPA